MAAKPKASSSFADVKAANAAFKAEFGPPPGTPIAKPPPEPESRPYALAGLKWTPKGYVVVIARFADDELQELTEHGPPEALKQYATTRLIRRIKHL